MHPISPRVRQASIEDHPEILKIAKQSKYTKDFSNHIFSGAAHYAKGWIRIAVLKDRVVGFTCFRQKVRPPETKLYFIGVDGEFRGRGVGRVLLQDLENRVVGCRMALDCCKENPACSFYDAAGFTAVEEALEGTAWRYVKLYEQK